MTRAFDEALEHPDPWCLCPGCGRLARTGEVTFNIVYKFLTSCDRPACVTAAASAQRARRTLSDKAA